MWIVVNFPQEVTNNSSFADLEIGSISPGICLMLGHNPALVRGSTLGTLLAGSKFDPTVNFHFRKIFLFYELEEKILRFFASCTFHQFCSQEFTKLYFAHLTRTHLSPKGIYGSHEAMFGNTRQVWFFGENEISHSLRAFRPEDSVRSHHGGSGLCEPEQRSHPVIRLRQILLAASGRTGCKEASQRRTPH